MPTRFVSKEEAEHRGWKLFYTGELCRWGHRAPRYVNNISACVDCIRVRNKQLPIGLSSERLTAPTKAVTSRAATVSNEPDALDKLFLTEYVKTKSFAEAAKACGRTEPEFLGRLSWNKIFRDAVNQLESDNGLARTPSMLEDFEWTDDKRAVLLRTYIDKGDKLQAMRAIGVSNYHFEKEMEVNAEFRDEVGQAEELAHRQLDGEAVNRALAGDSRLLQRVLSAKMPDQYGDKIKMDLHVANKATDDQLSVRIAQGFAKLERLGFKIPVPELPVDAEFTPVESGDNSDLA